MGYYFILENIQENSVRLQMILWERREGSEKTGGVYPWIEDISLSNYPCGTFKIESIKITENLGKLFGLV